MAFVDELTFYAKAGNGGNGIVSWRKMKNLAKGGPAGGNGGNGGDVYVRGIRDLTRLSNYTGNPKFVAEKGHDGMRDSKYGYNGEDLYIDLPVGSRVKNKETGEEFQILSEGEERLLLKGGQGGLGNEHFKSSRNVTPQEQTDGTLGEEGTFVVELEMLVDLGLVGLPSAGKSSLLNALTSAKAKVGSYPFTTLEPNLGDFYGYIIADIPGLISGASAGKGLGHKFLRHIKRTKAIAHLVSLEYDDPWAEYQGIVEELSLYSKELPQKPELVILSKSDEVDQKKISETVKLFESKGKDVQVCSILDDAQLKITAEKIKAFLDAQN